MPSFLLILNGVLCHAVVKLYAAMFGPVILHAHSVDNYQAKAILPLHMHLFLYGIEVTFGFRYHLTILRGYHIVKNILSRYNVFCLIMIGP